MPITAAWDSDCSRRFVSDNPICPSNDPDGCNVYKSLPFPQDVFDKINAYYEQKAEA